MSNVVVATVRVFLHMEETVRFRVALVGGVVRKKKIFVKNVLIVMELAQTLLIKYAGIVMEQDITTAMSVRVKAK